MGKEITIIYIQMKHTFNGSKWNDVDFVVVVVGLQDRMGSVSGMS